MPLRWDPDDPRWLNVAPDIRPMDLQVLRQVGVPEPVLQLALRDEVPGCAVPLRGGRMGGYRIHADLSFLDELEEDPDARPYSWDLPDDCRDYRRY